MYKNFIYFLFLTGLLSACHSNHYYEIRGYAQGTTYKIIYESLEDKDYSFAIDSILKAFDKSLSVYDSTSIISRINANDTALKLDDWFVTCFNTGKRIAAETHNAFDMTVGPLVEAYGFWKKPHLELDSFQIDSIMQFVGFDKIRIENNRIVKDNPLVRIDANAIAQGYSVDIVAEYLEKNSCENFLVEIGGELKAKGINMQGKKWRVGVDKPIENSDKSNEELQTIIALSNGSLATSGDYRKFYIENGIKYAHTINPHTGYPARSDLLSVSILADKCIDADAYATACMVMGLEKSFAFINSLPNVEAYFIYRDTNGNMKVKMTKGLKKHILK